MSLTDHVGILVAGSFDRPQKNKLKANAPAEYYAVVAFEPSAGGVLAELMAGIAPGGNWQTLQHSVKPNRTLAKPYAGIPDDALIVRFATQYPVEVRGEDGHEIPPSVENSPRIRSQLFAGQRVRINGAPYTWSFSGKNGISWNLYGAMAVGGGERRPGAANGGGFEKYIPQDAPAQQSAQQSATFDAQDAVNQSAPAQNAVANDPFAQKPATGGGAFG